MDISGRQRTLTDGCSQVSHIAALAARIARWLRDEEANASESSMGDTRGVNARA